ncbi:MAG: hypothetical protein Q7R86_01030 [bacterium]|nr:hypothetical protein [bacterium]
MTKINPKRIALGVIICGSFLFLQVYLFLQWLTLPSFPYLWMSNETWCGQQALGQTFSNYDQYQYYFEYCLIHVEENGRTPIIPNNYEPIIEPVIIEETG